MRAILNARVLLRDALVIALMAAAVAVAAAAQLLDRGTQVYTYNDQQTFRSSRLIRVEDEDQRTILHTIRFDSHGGTVRAEWYDGAWSPLTRRTAAVVSIYVDGRRVASATLGARTGQFEARPAVLVWVGRPPAGRHVIDVKVDAAPRGFAIPFASRTAPVTDGLTVTEVVE